MKNSDVPVCEFVQPVPPVRGKYDRTRAVPEHCQVVGGNVVTHGVHADTIVAGSPAKVIRLIGKENQRRGDIL